MIACTTRIDITTHYMYKIQLEIKYMTMTKSDANCSDVVEIDPYTNALIDERMEVYQTARRKHRLALYCYGDVTRNSVLYSDWNDMSATIHRMKRWWPLIIVSIYTRIPLVYKATKMTGL